MGDEAPALKDEPDAGKARFKPPSFAEVTSFCLEHQPAVNPQAFFNYYQANGWRVGSNPMRDWKAAVNKWALNEYPAPSPAKSSAKHPAAVTPPVDHAYQEDRRTLLELNMKYSTLLKDLTIDQIISTYSPPNELCKRLREYKNWRSMSRDDGLKRELFLYLESAGIEGLHPGKGLS